MATPTLPAGAKKLDPPIQSRQYAYDPDGGKFYALEWDHGPLGIPSAGSIPAWKEITDQSKINNVISAYGSQLKIDPSKRLGSLSAGPIGGSISNTKETNLSLRYPSDFIYDETNDYIFFQFGKYREPFGVNSANSNTGATNQFDAYNASVKDLEIQTLTVKDPQTNSNKKVETIFLPMPQDLANELKSDWQAKSFTRLGKTAISALAGGDFQKLGSLKDAAGNLQAFQSAISASILNKIPGVAGNLTLNDISGSTRGIVLNPNAEVLYDSPNMREIGMVFKMVPKNRRDAYNIKMICDTFRAASLPTFGGSGGIESFEAGGGRDPVNLTADNFIRVPYLCKFSFMTGSGTNKWLAQFKPCAITRVQVNYTPDGTYAAYGDSSPIATELSINFLESKLIYQNEVAEGF